MLQAILFMLSFSVPSQADHAEITVDGSHLLHRVSPLLYGACIEDVNHEIYGGLYSQMIFGESFQEPERSVPLRGFSTFGGEWNVRDGVLEVGPGDGPKLVSDLPPFADGQVRVELRFTTNQGGNAGLILRVDQPRVGADAWTGYEVSLESAGYLVLGRHRDNWEPLRRVPCGVPLDKWIPLVVRMNGPRIEVLVDGRSVLSFEDKEHPQPAGRLGLRAWQRPAQFRNLKVAHGDAEQQLAFEPRESNMPDRGVSRMWAAVHKGTAQGRFELVRTEPFIGVQCQRLVFEQGEGAIGVENRGLNRWGLNALAGKSYDGYVWTRTDKATRLALSFESAGGSRTLAQKHIDVPAGGWTRQDFTLTADADDGNARFTIALESPATVELGHVFVQPGEWGRFKGLPVRKDVADALIDEGVTILRYGGSMINHPMYRWKKMIGPRDRRPMHAGTWYAYSSNGWGIIDFLNFCEAAGFVAIPALNMEETPQDMADFVEYINGPANSEWGKRRATDGHPEPYRLKHIELGNEEAVNENYWQRFRPLAEAMWAKDPEILLVVGDFAYGKVIENPFRFEGGVAVNTLAIHQKILELAREHNREVWFDIHVGTDHPPEPRGLLPERSYMEQLGKLAPGARYKVAFFEYNSGNHAMKRALSNALATNAAERIGDKLTVACSANCLQCDGQNDNGWDQGLLFLNPSQVWLQPPGHLIRMARRQFQPLLVRSEVRGAGEMFSVNAKRSEDGKVLVLQVVNAGDASQRTQIEIRGISLLSDVASVEQLSGGLDEVNTADNPNRIEPVRSQWKPEKKAGHAEFTFPPRSITTIRFE